MATESFREKLISEIISTEKTYIEHLELLIKWYHNPLMEAKLLPKEIFDGIFNYVTTIFSVNIELYAQIRNGNIGEAFLRMAPYLKLYSDYAKNFEHASALVQEWTLKHKEFGNFKARQECRPETKGYKLNSLLITPVQRIPRYKMLLEELAHNTDEDMEDYELLLRASKEIALVAEHINSHIEERQNVTKLLEIQKCLGGKNAPYIVAPGRSLIRQGILKKMPSGKHGKVLERMAILMTDIFMYAKSNLLDGSQTKYTCCCVLPLRHCQVVRVLGPLHAKSNNEAKGVLFSVQCKNVTVLFWTDKSDGDAWIEDLQKSITLANERRTTLRKSSSSKGPVRGARAALRKRHLSSVLSNKRHLVGQNTEGRNMNSKPSNDESFDEPVTKRKRLSKAMNGFTYTSSEETNTPSNDNWFLKDDEQRVMNHKNGHNSNIIKTSKELCVIL